MSNVCSIKEVSFDITYDCSLKCLHCSNGGEPKKQSLSFETFKAIFDKISENNFLKIVEFGGGEPFLHDQFCSMVQYVSRSTQEIIVYSSGCIPLNNKKNTSIGKSCAEHLKKIGVTQVNLTVHSHFPAIHNYISNLKNGLERVYCSIRNLNHQKIDVCLHIVITRLNVETLKETMERLDSSFRITQFRLLRFVPQGQGLKNSSIFTLHSSQFDTKNLILSLPNQIRRKTTVAGFPSFIKCRPHHIIQRKCAAGVEFIHVLPNGIIIPCPAFKALQNNPQFGLSVEKFLKNDYHWNKEDRNQCWGQESIQLQLRKE